MDRKSVLTIVVCFGLLFALRPLTDYFFPPKPLPPGATNQPPATVASPVPGLTNVPPTATHTTPITSPMGSTQQVAFVASGEEEILVLTNGDARYIFTSLGGGLKRVELLHYPETVSRRQRKQPLTNNLAELNAHVEVPVLAILGGDAIQGDNIFNMTRSRTGVRAEKTLPNGLRLTKEFQPTTNYLVATTVRLENTSAQPIGLPEQRWNIGTASRMGPDDDGQTVGLMWYNGSDKEEVGVPWFENRTLGCIPGVPRAEYRAGTSNVLWASVHNQFFALVAMPLEPAQQIVSVPVEVQDPSLQGDAAQGKGAMTKAMQTAFAYPPVVLPPGKAIERQINFFAGPKEYRTLAKVANRFQNNVDLVMGFGGFFGFFSKGLLLAMNWLHNTFHFGYGMAIIVITLIVKLLFWPLTQASTKSMKRMAALQPQMKALQAKYKEDPAKMNKKLMEFMKENKVSPLGGCLPMLLQMPVFIGFFYMIRSAIELRGAPFLWVADLSQPDTLFMIPGLNFPFNLLPLLMGATMLWQSHLTPPSPGMDPMQQKMLRYMPLIFLVFLYNYSSGLALYWTVQNLLSILQTKLTKSVPLPAAQPVSVLTPVSKKKK